MKKTRNLHLWIGLICSVFLLLEAVTGLLLTERWLMGMGGHSHGNHEHAHGDGHAQLNMIDAVKKASESGAFSMDEVGVVMNHGMYMVRLNDKDGTLVTIAPDGTVVKKEVNHFASFVRAIHVGKLGLWNRLIIDVAAISIIILTGTGIYLSVKILRAQAKAKRRKAVA
ncbi:putative iron-regulated membrane protein [Anoxybacillus mongoliensis]|uniref:Putative iron-regulated membrane protein n=1 Tax=Anoxybacillus mongoliensis TaxID=452565 RepID=A0A7W8JC97_9BACL|nr:PepSY-associated TM helix domain-containing protein [Anoxybacillus mongoliensis]MBB5354432.1 putative iron-regulated membrane protein [Anoxybacillus mongoliensis]